MEQIALCDGWRFCRLGEEGAGTPVRIPHDAMLGERRSATSPGGINTGWFEGCDYQYTRNLAAPETWRGKHALLEFEGVYHNAEVWVNGSKAAFRPYGYTNFYVDLDPYLNYGGDNEVKVIARNADQPNSRWYSGAGIYRPVSLWLGDRDRHLPPNAIRVKTVGIQPPEVEIEVRTAGTGPVTITLLDGENALASVEKQSDGRARVRLRMKNARLWSPEQPWRYRCRAAFGADTAETDFGIRTLDWSGDQGLTLNGKRVILRGACDHHTNGILGACCYPDAVERKVRLLRQSGYNAIRSAHNPCSKALLEACDRLGMLVMDEYIDHWYIHKTHFDYVDYFDDWWRQDLRDMVEKDYNHPCVVLYSIGNEVSETAQPKGIALTRELTEYLHRLDGTRPVTCGVNIFFNFLSSIGLGVYSDDKAQKELEAAEKARQAGKAKKDKAVGSQFFNNLAGLLGDEFMKRGATLRGCDRKTRDAFANMDIAGYNYGIYRYRHDLKQYPDRLILGSETFCADAYAFWELAKQEPRIIGDFVWAGMDYLGEVMLGSWEYADYAKNFTGDFGWIAAGQGRMDLTGKPSCEAQYTRVALEQAKGPFLGVVPVNHAGEKHSPSAWRMSNALESWSWEGCEGRTASVEVYVRAASVELLLNGTRVGRKRLKKDCVARFTCPYQPGTLEAVARDEAGREIGRTALRSAGAETQLRAEPEEETTAPDRLCYIRLRFTDGAGILKPQRRGIIRTEVAGGTLLALGSGCPYNERGYLLEETDTYFGEALAIVRADGTGPVRLTARSGGLTAETVIPLRP